MKKINKKDNEKQIVVVQRYISLPTKPSQV